MTLYGRHYAEWRYEMILQEKRRWEADRDQLQWIEDQLQWIEDQHYCEEDDSYLCEIFDRRLSLKDFWIGARI